MTASRRRTKILIVEDYTDMRALLCDVLTEKGFATAAARNGADAMDVLLSREPPDLVLMDLMMRPVNGYRLIAALHQTPTLASIPFILFSGEAHLPDIAAAVGAAGFAAKGTTGVLEVVDLIMAVLPPGL